MAWTPPRDHPWRTTFPEHLAELREIPKLTASEIVAIKIMRWREYSWAKIGRILDVPAFIAMRAMSPTYKPLKES